MIVEVKKDEKKKDDKVAVVVDAGVSDGLRTVWCSLAAVLVGAGASCLCLLVNGTALLSRLHAYQSNMPVQQQGIAVGGCLLLC